MLPAPFVAWVPSVAVVVAPFAAPSTSDFVIRPAGPLPDTSARFTPSTAAARAATGETFVPSGALPDA